jgi:hypothetical protein
MLEPIVTTSTIVESSVSGQFVDIAGDRYYAIHNVDRLDPFFISIVSNDDHWLFVSSTGGLTAGRVSPETALFPYVTVDKIHESTAHTGSKTLLRIHTRGEIQYWEPFNREQYARYTTSRNLYKNALGNKLCFEEVNHDLELAFRYTWATSGSFGFVRQCELQNLSDKTVTADLLDGLQNILPAGTPIFAQTNTSNLVDAYKSMELDETSGLALFTLYAGISDRAEPYESLKATTVFCLGLDGQKVLISSQQLKDFRRGKPMEQEQFRRGVRGAYLVSLTLELAPKASQHWQIVANLEQSQGDVVELRRQLREPANVFADITRSVETGSDELAHIVARGDGFQATAEENVTAHHFATVLFNILRGGIFDDQYNVSSQDFAAAIKHFNENVYRRNQALIEDLPDKVKLDALLSIIRKHGDDQLERLSSEYLPLTFGRRHGDPSRPWNHFEIKPKDGRGKHPLAYEGNWRDIFQNWEALAFSYPGFVESLITKFVNASTVDGYNPYRIDQHGFDWEVQETDNPWSNIGYWGDHQIIYLQKLLELSKAFNPTRLRELLHRSIFCYADVPYRLKPFAEMLENPKSTVSYDHKLAEQIERRVLAMGADGKLVLDSNDAAYQVNLLEKLLVPLLCKLGNLVIDGGIWLNTQRPEWNDANNALVGHGLSMVTLYYMRRYVAFLKELLTEESDSFALSCEVGQLLDDTAIALRDIRELLGVGPIDNRQRYDALVTLGQAGSRYRECVYKQGGFSGQVTQPLDQIMGMLDDALAVIDLSISANRREDGLYHSYNLLDLRDEAVAIDNLYPMLEGQVAVLSAGAIAPEEAVKLLQALFASDVYRPDQRSFMLYPDRNLPGFLAKNRIRDEQIEAIPLLQRMLSDGDERIVLCDADGCCRFNPEFTNADSLKAQLNALAPVYGAELEAARGAIEALYEEVFNHRAFTGRSGTMFGFEGLGSVYWHMVSKLRLAVQENFFAALARDTDAATCQRLGALYYRVREGLGFNKTPAEYGAFPTDPYSHTPKHAGARQPGMTGQVKEDVLCRFGELGVRVSNGEVRFRPDLLRACEFTARSRDFKYLDVDGVWQVLTVPPAGLAFTWCQVPVIYKLDNDAEPGLCLTWDDGRQEKLNQIVLPADESGELFQRSGRVRKLELTFGTDLLFAE